MKTLLWSKEKVRDNPVYWVFFGIDSERAGIYRQVGDAVRDSGENVNELLPVVINGVSDDNFIVAWFRNLFSTPEPLYFVKKRNIIGTYTAMDLYSHEPLKAKYIFVGQNVDDPDENIIEKLHPSIEETRELQTNKIYNLMQENELLLAENEQLRQRDKSREREENERLNERQSASWVRRTQE